MIQTRKSGGTTLRRKPDLKSGERPGRGRGSRGCTLRERSAAPVCGGYVVDSLLLAPRRVVSACQNFEVNLVSLSVIHSSGQPCTEATLR